MWTLIGLSFIEILIFIVLFGWLIANDLNMDKIMAQNPYEGDPIVSELPVTLEFIKCTYLLTFFIIIGVNGFAMFVRDNAMASFLALTLWPAILYTISFFMIIALIMERNLFVFCKQGFYRFRNPQKFYFYSDIKGFSERKVTPFMLQGPRGIYRSHKYMYYIFVNGEDFETIIPEDSKDFAIQRMLDNGLRIEEVYCLGYARILSVFVKLTSIVIAILILGFYTNLNSNLAPTLYQGEYSFEQGNNELPLHGNVSMLRYKDMICVYMPRYIGMNFYDFNGQFMYSVKFNSADVPTYNETLTAVGDVLSVCWNNRQVSYKTDEFVSSMYVKEYEDFSRVFYVDAEDGIKSFDVKLDAQVNPIGHFNGCTYYWVSVSDEVHWYKTDGKTTKEVYYEDVAALSMTNASTELDIDGVHYYSAGGNIHRVENGDDRIIVKSNLIYIMLNSDVFKFVITCLIFLFSYNITNMVFWFVRKRKSANISRNLINQ